jgi:hypothetical protein
VIASLVGFVAGAAVLAAVAVAAGWWDRSGASPSVLNPYRVEAAIEASILKERHLRSVASCPAVVEQQRGAAFYCRVTVKSRDYLVFVDQVDNTGGVDFRVL